MSASNEFETALLDDIFNQVTIPGLTLNLFVALHTAVLDDTADQSTNEATYGGYARVSTSRNAAVWDIDGNIASNVQEILFPECISGAETLVSFSIGLADGPDAGMIVVYGELTPSVDVAPGVTPRFKIGTLQTTVD